MSVIGLRSYLVHDMMLVQPF